MPFRCLGDLLFRFPAAECKNRQQLTGSFLGGDTAAEPAFRKGTCFREFTRHARQSDKQELVKLATVSISNFFFWGGSTTNSPIRFMNPGSKGLSSGKCQARQPSHRQFYRKFAKYPPKRRRRRLPKSKRIFPAHQKQAGCFWGDWLAVSGWRFRFGEADASFGWQQIAAGLDGWRRALEGGQVWEEAARFFFVFCFWLLFSTRLSFQPAFFSKTGSVSPGFLMVS